MKLFKVLALLGLSSYVFAGPSQPPSGNYIQLRTSLQAGATFYVSSGTATNLYSSTFTPTNIIGKTTGVAAPTGDWGEEISSSVVRSAGFNIPTATALSVATATLTAGVWEVRGACGFLPATITSITYLECTISKTANAEPSADTIAVPNSSGEIKFPTSYVAFIPNGDVTIGIQPTRVVITSQTTYHITAVSVFTASTMKAYGHIYARRIQ